MSWFQAEGGDAGLADVEEADMASSEEGDEEEEDSSGKTIKGSEIAWKQRWTHLFLRLFFLNHDWH